VSFLVRFPVVKGTYLEPFFQRMSDHRYGYPEISFNGRFGAFSGQKRGFMTGSCRVYLPFS